MFERKLVGDFVLFDVDIQLFRNIFKDYQNKEIIRTVRVDSNISIDVFVQFVLKSFGFDFDQAYSICMYSKNDIFKKINLSDSYHNILLNELLKRKNKKNILLYDFATKWVFVFNLQEIIYTKKPLKKSIVMSKKGSAPKQYSNKTFKSFDSFYNECLKSQTTKITISPKVLNTLFNVTGVSQDVDVEDLSFEEKLNTGKLEYTAKNFNKYAHFIAEKLTFPFQAFYSDKTDMFGETIYEVSVKKIDLDVLSSHIPKDGLKCICDFGTKLFTIPLGIIQTNNVYINGIINKYKQWQNNCQ